MTTAIAIPIHESVATLLSIKNKNY